MSDTPETDAFQSSGKAHYMAVEFARRLERERDKWRKCAEKLAEIIGAPDEIESRLWKTEQPLYVLKAIARQRAEAFSRTLGKCEDAK